MADVTRYIVDEWWPVEGAERVQDGQLIVIAEADYLATLERVRVETLREERAAIMALRAFIVGKTALRDWDINEVVKGFDDAVAAIDRLINAATTGATDD